MPDPTGPEVTAADAHHARLVAGLAGQYTIERELGQGGMAVVYLAHDHRHDRRVAVKVLRPELSSPLGGERFLREIKIAATLTHPHVLGMHDSGAVDGILYYVMPYIEGETLRDRISRERQLPIEEAIEIASQVAKGLDHAHAAGVIHRDIKPENILFSDGHALIADFGIGRVLNVALTGSTLTEPGVALGTPAYMSPEQGCHEVIDARSDIYALGCLTYEMLVGEPPFTGPTAQMVIARHVAAPVPGIRTVRGTVAPATEAAIHRALAKLPVDRFATAAEFAAALRDSGSAPTTPAVASPSSRVSIVVLPFANLSPNSDTEHLSDGIADGILTDLSAIRNLGVISSTSAMQLKGTEKDIRTIGRELGVRYVLEGTLRTSGSQLRITTKLVDADVDVLVWASKFTGSFDDVLELEEQVSRQVLEALQLAISPDEDRKLAERPIPDSRAYEYYLRGRQETLKFTEEALEHALEYLTKGLEIVGENAELLSAIGYVHFQYLNAGISTDPVHVQRAREVAERIERIEQGSPHAARLRGLIALVEGEIAEEIRCLGRALEANPNDPDALLWLTLILGFVGRTPEAWPLVERLLRIDPLTSFYRMLPGFLALMQGELPAALGPFRDTVLREPGNPIVRQFYGQIQVLNGQHDAARETFLELHRDAPETFFASLGMLFVHALAGDQEAARAVLGDEFRAAALGDAQYAWSLAQVAMLLGDETLCLEALGEAVSRGFWNAEFLAHHDPILAPLRGTPRFESLVEDARRQAGQLAT